MWVAFWSIMRFIRKLFGPSLDELVEIEIEKKKAKQAEQCISHAHQIHSVQDVPNSSETKPTYIPLREKITITIDGISDEDEKTSIEDECHERSSYHNRLLNYDTISSFLDEFVAFDLETTGFSCTDDRIIEISAIKFVGGKEHEHFSSLINPGIRIPSSATKVNRITNDMVKDAPSEKDVMLLFVEFIGNAIIGKTLMVAHNASFDISFLVQALQRNSISCNLYYHDTLALSRKYIQGLGNHKLATISDHLSLNTNSLHRSYNDASLCGNIFVHIMRNIKILFDEKITSLKPEEVELCKYLKSLLSSNNVPLDLLCFKTGPYLSLCCVYPTIKFKLGPKKKYVIVHNSIKAPSGLITEPCTKSEGESLYRIHFKTIDDLSPISNYFVSYYNAKQQYYDEYMSISLKNKNQIHDIISEMITI